LKSEVKKKMTIKLREVAVPKSRRVNFARKSQQKSSAREVVHDCLPGHAMSSRRITEFLRGFALD
jgi:hypothetical protein